MHNSKVSHVDTVKLASGSYHTLANLHVVARKTGAL